MLPLSEQGSPHPLLCHLPSSQNTPSNGNSSCTCSSEEHIPTACCILPPSHMLFGLCPWHTPQVPGGNELACLVHNGILCTWCPACHITGADEKLSSRRNVHHHHHHHKNRSHQLLSMRQCVGPLTCLSHLTCGLSGTLLLSPHTHSRVCAPLRAHGDVTPTRPEVLTKPRS